MECRSALLVFQPAHAAAAFRLHRACYVVYQSRSYTDARLLIREALQSVHSDRIMLLHYESLSYFGEAIWPKVFAFLDSASQPFPRPLPELPTFRNANEGYTVTKL